MNILELRRRTLGKGVYKKTVEGNPAIAQGSLARMYPGITMRGWTEQNSTTGAQLINPTLEEVTNEGITIRKNDDGTYRVEGTTSDTMVSVKIASVILPVGTYTLTGTEDVGTGGEGWNSRFRTLKEDTFGLVGDAVDSPLTQTLEQSGASGIYIQVNKGVTINATLKPMLNKGSTALPYEPYTGGAPSPSPDYPQEIVSAGKYDEESRKYSVDVKLTGKNLFNKVKCSNADVWKQGINYYYVAIPVPKGSKISVSYAEKPPLGFGFYTGISKKPGDTSVFYAWLYHSTLENLIRNHATFTAESNEIYLSLNAPSINIELFMDHIGNSLQIEVSDVPTDYQPYKEQTVTLTSDRPLTKWDRLEKRSGQWGWVYKSAKKEFDGSADESWEKYSNIGFRIVLGEMKSGTSLDGFCTRFENVKDYIFDKTGIRFGVDNNVMYINTSTITVELQDFKLLLQSNPIKVLFETETSEFVPLSEEEQEQMNALYTFRPTTVLSNDVGCNMELTYKTKKSLQSVPGGGIKKPSGVTSYFAFWVKWNQVNKIVFKISGVTEKQNMLLCGSSMNTPYIAVNNEYYPSFVGASLNNFSASISAEEVLDGEYHEIVFTFDTPRLNKSIVNIWDGIWSKNIVYHEIAFYNGDELLADYVPYYKGAGYMLDKKNNVVIRATNPDDYQFA